MPAPNEGTTALPSDVGGRFHLGWWDGSAYQAPRGDVANGLDVDITRLPGDTAQIAVTPTITATPYTPGDSVGGKITLTGAMRIANGTGLLQSVFLKDRANAKAALDLLLFSEDPAGGTYTDNSPVPLNAADIDSRLIRRIPVLSTDWQTIGVSPNQFAVADLDALSKVVRSTGGNSNLYLVIHAVGSPTYAAGVLTLNFGFLRD
jgi:hypothetical protein